MIEDLVPPQRPGAYLRKHFLRPVEGTRIEHKALAEAMGVSRVSVSLIINGHCRITADMALRLAYVLGTSADLWLDMQKSVDLFEARQKLEAECPKLTRLR